MVSTHWSRNFVVNQQDIEYVTNVLLERETPMTTSELALLLIQKRLDEEQAIKDARFADTTTYNPAESYKTGQRIVFPAINYAVGTVEGIRSGQNQEYGTFSVIQVEFDNDNGQREFAAELTTHHKLMENPEGIEEKTAENLSPKEILQTNRNHMLRQVAQALEANVVLERIAGYWFPSELVLDIDIGTLHLSEAVLDVAGGGPLTTDEILDQIGGIGEAPKSLQIFSLNLGLRDDSRFDEVGPAGEVLWYLNAMEPGAVREIPAILRYKEIEYNEDILSDDLLDLETILDDELTPIDFEGDLQRATTTLIYPHRRAGTLPLNAKTRQIFPTGRTSRIFVELVDASDGEKFTGWIVHEFKYVFGLDKYYSKHNLPIGAFITVEEGEEPHQVILSHDAHKARTEWIRVLIPHDEQIIFENKKRAIGADYDDLMIVGVDDLASLDKLVKLHQNKTLAAIIRSIINSMARLSPQGTVHAKNIYSAVNLIRRCPPGPIFAILCANPDFEDVGDHYWKLSE